MVNIERRSKKSCKPLPNLWDVPIKTFDSLHDSMLVNFNLCSLLNNYFIYPCSVVVETRNFVWGPHYVKSSLVFAHRAKGLFLFNILVWAFKVFIICCISSCSCSLRRCFCLLKFLWFASFQSSDFHSCNEKLKWKLEISWTLRSQFGYDVRTS